MFTGLVDDVGVVERVETTDAGREFRVRCRYDDLVDGESIACDGVCLTVREKGAGWFTVAAAFMTLERTTLGEWTVGRRVNLERALRLGDRLGGHMVQGHVDGVGEVRSAEMHEDALLIDVAVPEEIDALLVPHGSITLDGVSLTVNALPAPGVVQVSIIEYTRRHTSLGDRKAGDPVNVEADMIAKHVQRLVAPHLTTRT
ncbi:MAG TPA: riboflavin synthase [Gemmatimonadaceae bacterium]|nr:riboflavin synthase [Gemmatimonadaceae bacterium]